MSVIIRLQNLPWSASSLDIRRYFSGLSIPDGGVHILGGEKGDAFIAFASDEDARQAMSRDGGTIKDAKIKLLLSSRNEMKLVVEQARSTMAAAAAAANCTGDASKNNTLRTTNQQHQIQPQQQQQQQQSHVMSQDATTATTATTTPATSLGTCNVSTSLPSSFTCLSNVPPPAPVMTRSTLGSSGVLVSDVHTNYNNAANNSGTGLGGGSIPGGSGGSGGMFFLDSNGRNGGTNSFGGDTSTGLAGNSLLGMGLNTCSSSSSATISRDAIKHASSRGANARARSRSPINRMASGNAGHAPPMAGMMQLNGNHFNELTRADSTNSYTQGTGATSRDNWSRSVDFNSVNSNNSGNLAVGSTNGIIANNNQPQGQGIWRVEVRGFPFNVSPRDIQEFFRLSIGLYVFYDSIEITIDHRGFTMGGAVVTFEAESYFNAALSISGRMFGDRKIHIFPCSTDAMVPGCSSSQQVSSQHQQLPQTIQEHSMPGRDLVVYMKGIPFNMCTDRDVLKFFSGLRIEQIVFEFDQRTGKIAGNAFVEFTSKQDYENALEFNLKHMGRRYIEVFPTTLDDMEEARRIVYQISGGSVPGMACNLPGKQPQRVSQKLNGIRGDDLTSKATYCINITGLPPTITNTDLTTYFKEAGALPFAIHIMLKGNGFNAGEAFVEFLSQEHQQIALLRDGDVLDDHRISVKDVPFNLMNRIVRPNSPPGLTGGSIGPVAHGNNHHPPGPPGVTGGGCGGGGGGGSGGGGPGCASSFRGGFNDRGFRGGHRFNGPRMRGEMNGRGGQLMAGDASCPGSGGGNDGGRRRDAFADGRCVVLASNVPYKATNEDLREFFADFNVLANGIERRLNDRGLATPEARIAFINCQQAEDAVKLMHKKTLFGRQIFLRLAL